MNMPPMGNDAPANPNMMGGDPSMGGDPNMADPSMGGVPEMGGDPSMEGENQGSGDDTLSLFNKLSEKDKESARSYIESMVNKDNENSDEMGNQEMPMESVIFTKKKLNEEFGIENLSSKKDDSNTEKKTKKTNIKNSPFSSPKFE